MQGPATGGTAVDSSSDRLWGACTTGTVGAATEALDLHAWEEAVAALTTTAELEDSHSPEDLQRLAARDAAGDVESFVSSLAW
jgi:hypothetical protein